MWAGESGRWQETGGFHPCSSGGVCWSRDRPNPRVAKQVGAMSSRSTCGILWRGVAAREGARGRGELCWALQTAPGEPFPFDCFCFLPPPSNLPWASSRPWQLSRTRVCPGNQLLHTDHHGEWGQLRHGHGLVRLCCAWAPHNWGAHTLGGGVRGGTVGGPGGSCAGLCFAHPTWAAGKARPCEGCVVASEPWLQRVH